MICIGHGTVYEIDPVNTILADPLFKKSWISFLDRRFLALGFGGMVNNRVSHCFPLNGNSREPYCYGINGVIEAYYDSLANGEFETRS